MQPARSASVRAWVRAAQLAGKWRTLLLFVLVRAIACNCCGRCGGSASAAALRAALPRRYQPVPLGTTRRLRLLPTNLQYFQSEARIYSELQY